MRGTLPAAAEAADRRPDPLGTLSPLNRTASADPPKAFRRHAAELAQVEVRMLEPGDALTL